MDLARRERELALRDSEKADTEKRAQLEREEQLQLRRGNIAEKWTFSLLINNASGWKLGEIDIREPAPLFSPS